MSAVESQAAPTPTERSPEFGARHNYYALGPLLAGTLFAALTGTFGRESIRYALISIVAVGYVWAAVHYWLARRRWNRT